MLKIVPEALSQEAIDQLSALQQQVDQQPSHADQYDKAKELWGTGKKPFPKIKEKLAACSQRGSEEDKVSYCHYCEADRVQAIEHIYPKSAFPERAYLWENYIYACWYCNSKLKHDRYFIFDPKQSAICSNQLKGSDDKAPNDDLALIDLRVDDPTEMLYLILTTGHFVIALDLEKEQASTQDQRKAIKAQNTLDLLKLNDLSSKRSAAYSKYLDSLRRYAAIVATENYEELNEILATYIPSDRRTPTPDFEADKQEMLNRIQQSILQVIPHPTVWFEMKRQRKYKGFEALDQLMTTAQVDTW